MKEVDHFFLRNLRRKKEEGKRDDGSKAPVTNSSDRGERSASKSSFNLMRRGERRES